MNPVKSGVVLEPEAYRYSSARQYITNEQSDILNVELLDLGVNEGYVFR